MRAYLRVALKVLLRRKFFTAVSLFGVAFTLMVLVVAAALFDHTFGPHAPEVRQHRTLGLYIAEMSGEHATRTGAPGYRLLDEYARDLPGVEQVAMTTMPQTVYAYPRGEKLSLALKRTDAAFWEVLQFTFVEGGPYTAADVRDARRLAVVNATTRGRIFGGGPAVGRTFEVDGQSFRVSGVVEDVPWLRLASSGDVYVPLTTQRTDAYRRELTGNIWGLLLARSPADFPAIREEFAARLARIDIGDRRFTKFTSIPETTFEGFARFVLGDNDPQRRPARRLMATLLGAAFLFMLLPAINLVNLSVSRMLERAPEIGVRKAFGASSWSLVGQFVFESVVLALVGAAVGLVLAAFVLGAINRSGFIPYADLGVNYRVFLSGLGFALVFGVLSGAYPAWRMSRLHPVDALRGGTR
jgi:putative ABC transport system permease protein